MKNITLSTNAVQEVQMESLKQQVKVAAIGCQSPKKPNNINSKPHATWMEIPDIPEEEPQTVNQ